MQENKTRFRVLLVEDNPDDAEFAREAFAEAEREYEVSIAEDGERALAFLRGEDPRPQLILLDLNLPRKDGREVLAVIKADDELRRIPVLILTTSVDEDDLLNAYNLGANAYIKKPVDMDDFIRVVRGIENFWVETVRLPPA